MKYICCLITIFIIPKFAFATDLDSLLNAKINIRKSYLILNITSTECITCRTAAVNILDKIKNSVDSKKIVLLSDDKNMILYFNDNKDIFGGYQVIIDKKLSHLLANGGPSATACVIGKDTMHFFTLTKVNNDTITYIQSILSENADHHQKATTIIDSMIRSVSHFYFHSGLCAFLNTQFQVGLVYNTQKGVSAGMHVNCSDETTDRLLHILNSNGYHRLSPAKEGNALLRKKGVAPAMVGAINLHVRSACFKLYATSISVSENLNDTTVRFIPVMFIAKNLSQDTDLMNLNEYGSYTLLDKICDEKDTLGPLSDQNYEFNKDHLFMAYWNSRGSNFMIRNGRKIQKATDVRIAEMTLENNATAKKINVFGIHEGEAGPGSFYFRVSDEGLPIVVSKTNKCIDFLNKDKKISFSELIYQEGDTVNTVFDISSIHNVLRFVGMTTKNNFVKGTFNVLTGKIKIDKMAGDSVLFGNMRIEGNDILACRKEEDTNELILDRFVFE